MCEVWIGPEAGALDILGLSEARMGGCDSIREKLGLRQGDGRHGCHGRHG